MTVAVELVFTVNVQTAGPEQAPLQPRSAEPGSATATSLAFAPLGSTSTGLATVDTAASHESVSGPGLLHLSMTIATGGGGTSNPAEIDFDPLAPCPVRVNVHVDVVPAEAQSPPHPANFDPVSGVAVSVIVEFCLISAEHWSGQSIEPLVESGAGAVT